MNRESITERHVQAVWYDRAIRPESLRTSTGECVSVIYPGNWNLGAGPDFRNAVIEVGGRRMSGDVEVHLRPNDWVSHSHGDDPSYRNVIAHVTWSGGPIPKTLPKSAVSIWLGRYLTSDPGFAPEQIDVSAYPFARIPADSRPCFKRFAENPDLASRVLVSAGASRIREKSRRIAGFLNAPKGRRIDRRQLFYLETMSALGYGCNPHGFREVAAAVPLEVVQSEPYNAECAFLVAAQFVNWRRGMFRPNNSPEVRLKSAARLFAKGEILSVLEEVDFSPDRCRDIVALLVEGGVMGRGRAGAIVANVIVPFALAEGRLEAPPAWLPPEDVSEPVRLMAFRMLGRDHNPSVSYASNGMKIQGLMQVHLWYNTQCNLCRVSV